MKYISISENETKKIAFNLLKDNLKLKKIFLLYGDFGSGKTIFVKGMAKFLEIDEKKVKSPSFTFVREYKGKIPLIHFDLYRLKEGDDVNGIGLPYYLSRKSDILVIEWAEKCDIEFENCIKVYFNVMEDGRRELKITNY